MSWSARFSLAAVLVLSAVLFWPAALRAENGIAKSLPALAKNGSVLVVDAQGRRLAAHNPEKPLIPASILKIVTAAAALEVLGADYRFVTEFRLSPAGDLYVIGRGDPFLISEELARIAARLKGLGLKKVRRIYLDNSFFAPGLVLDGTARSLNPYDAYNGALCVNFNTINVKIGPQGRISSAERQTPLTPLAQKWAAKTKVRGKVRLNLAESPEACLIYAGELLKAFLEKAGIEVAGPLVPLGAMVEKGAAAPPLFYRHLSSRTLSQVIKAMFKYSNNFIANQIFLTMGAERFGTPANVAKARRTVEEFLAGLGVSDIHIEEGSGLSRRNRISAAQMAVVLKKFLPHRQLLTTEDRVLFKTGSLNDVKSLAGYLAPEQGPPLSFVIILNGPEFTTARRQKILTLLKENLL